MLTHERIFFFQMSYQFLRASFDYIFFVFISFNVHAIIYSNVLFIMHSLYIALTKPYIVAISKKKLSFHLHCL